MIVVRIICLCYRIVALFRDRTIACYHCCYHRLSLVAASRCTGRTRNGFQTRSSFRLQESSPTSSSIPVATVETKCNFWAPFLGSPPERECRCRRLSRLLIYSVPLPTLCSEMTSWCSGIYVYNWKN